MSNEYYEVCSAIHDLGFETMQAVNDGNTSLCVQRDGFTRLEVTFDGAGSGAVLREKFNAEFDCKV